MPALPNHRHELYAIHRAKGFSPSKAGQAAGFASGSSTISALEKDPEVIARIEDVLKEMSEQKEQRQIAARESARKVGEMTGKSRAWVIEQLAQVAQLAASAEDFPPAIQALKLIGDELGMFKGDNPDGQGSNVPAEVPFDQMESILNLSAPEEQPGDGALNVTPEEVLDEAVPGESLISDKALALISGQGPHAARIREARKLKTGSETDVAMSPLSEPDPDEEHEAVWQRVTREIDVTDIRVAMDEPDAPEPEAEDDDVPPPRSKGRRR